MQKEQHVVKLTRTIRAKPSAVYRAWLDPEKIRAWMAPGMFEASRAEVDEREGGTYRVWHAIDDEEVGGFESEILELVPNRTIAFRWDFADRAAGRVYDSRLTVTFRPAPGASTELTLVQEKLAELARDRPDIAENVGVGWEMVVERLATLLGR